MKYFSFSPLYNKIYQLVGDTTKVRYNLDFGKYNLSSNELKNKTLNEIVDLMSAGEKDYFGILNLFENSIFDFLGLHSSADKLIQL